MAAACPWHWLTVQQDCGTLPLCSVPSISWINLSDDLAKATSSCEREHLVVLSDTLCVQGAPFLRGTEEPRHLMKFPKPANPLLCSAVNNFYLYLLSLKMLAWGACRSHQPVGRICSKGERCSEELTMTSLSPLRVQKTFRCTYPKTISTKPSHQKLGFAGARAWLPRT